MFLDIGGVLNAMPYFEAIKGKRDKIYNEIDGSKLPLLKRIVEENNAHIVLSSTWRNLDHEEESHCYAMWQYLVNSLAKYDMKIISKTPLIAQKRPLEIKTWLDNRVDKEDIKWISLDDDYSEEDYKEFGIGGHLVHTKFFTYNINDGGLQEKHVELAKQLFDRQ